MLPAAQLPAQAGPAARAPPPLGRIAPQQRQGLSGPPAQAPRAPRFPAHRLHASAESATERRMRESQRVDERVTPIDGIRDFDRELQQAGHNLVVLEVESQHLCQTGFDDEPEVHYKADQEAVLAPCRSIKHVFARTARDSPDVLFLAMDADTDEGQEACRELGIDVLPTVQFWRDGQKLWEHRGIVQLDSVLGEGVLYYGDTAANNVRASDHVAELSSRAQLDAWLGRLGPDELGVLDISSTTCSPCVHIFPAVLALAKNMVGFASFARLMADASEEASEIAHEFNIVQVPSFIFLRQGKEVGRHVGSTRGDLIGQILQQQSVLGLTPPAPASR